MKIYIYMCTLNEDIITIRFTTKTVEWNSCMMFHQIKILRPKMMCYAKDKPHATELQFDCRRIGMLYVSTLYL